MPNRKPSRRTRTGRRPKPTPNREPSPGVSPASGPAARTDAERKAAQALGTDGWFLHDDFLGADQVRELQKCAAQRRRAGEFKPARIGGGTAALRLEEVRGDAICWLEEPLFPAERHWLTVLEALRSVLNRELLLGLFEWEMHYALYPPGGAYARHVDQIEGSQARRVSLILYLNDDWQSQDGGQLRLHLGAEGAIDIEPIAGRLVGFLSERQTHEVLACRRERLSLSGWMRVRS